MMRLIRDLSYDNEKMLSRIYAESKHHQVRERAQCLLLSYRGKTIAELIKIFNVTRKTIYNWFTAWEDRKLLGLYDSSGRGRKPKLSEDQQLEVKKLVKESPKSLKTVQSKIKQEWGVEISKDTIKRIVKKFKMKWRRMKRGLSRKPSEWELDVKLPEIEKLKELHEKGEIDLGYLDQVGWSIRACIPYAWQEKDSQIILNDVEGKRINVMGIMNIKNEIYYEVYEKNTDSDKVIEFLDRFSETIKIRTVILLDQASIHTSDKIMERSEYWKEKNLELFWLPAYSPELNLIEILWRFMKYEWIEISAYNSHKSLKEYIDKTLKLFGSEYVINFA